MAPVHDAFSVPEVLEGIILNLPLRQIVRLRSLCGETRRIIDGRTLIQRAFWLQPTSNSILTWRLPFHNKRVSWMDAHDEGWYPDVDTRTPTVCDYLDVKDHPKARAPILNPFFPIAQNADQALHERQWYTRRYRHLFTIDGASGEYDYPWEELNVQLPSSFCPEHHYSEIFKAMQLSHPPIGQVHYHLPFRQAVTLSSPDGITIREMVESQVKRDTCKVFSSIAEEAPPGHNIALLVKTVDEITGYEMLEIFDSDLSQFNPELLIKSDDKGGTVFDLNQRTWKPRCAAAVKEVGE